MDWHHIQEKGGGGGRENGIFLGALYRRRNKLRHDGPLGSHLDFFLQVCIKGNFFSLLLVYFTWCWFLYFL